MDYVHTTRTKGSLETLILIFSVIFMSNATFTFQQDVFENNQSDFIGCFPCYEKFVVSPFFGKHNSLVDSGLEDLVDEKLLLQNSCKLSQHNTNELHRLTLSDRYLKGAGSHRHIVTTINVSINPTISAPDSKLCEVIVIERLPIGVFADPFELQHLVQRGLFLDAAVFGDTNLELPSALSNHSVVEIHQDVGHQMSSKLTQRLELTIELPLHARYPRFDSSGYTTVLFGQPDLMMRCKPKMADHSVCSSSLIRFKTVYSNPVMWQVPCGKEEHASTVSVVTFASALISSLLIVFFASYYSSSHKCGKNE